MGRILIGTSGFSYPYWGKGVFYPPDLKPRNRLTYYSHYFDTVEINSSFYRLPTTETLNRWRDVTPKDFIFAVKGSRLITHLKRLKHCEVSVSKFSERLSILDRKLGVILWQLPPSLPWSLEHLQNFLGFVRHLLPAARIVLEVRHPSWLVDEVFALLSEANVALCLSDWSQLRVTEPLTADFVYVRRHGITSLYDSCYPPKSLQVDMKRILGWIEAGFDVYVYFNNDACGYAVQNALQLKQLMKEFGKNSDIKS